MTTSSQKSPQKDKSTYEERLLSGEYNWRLKPDIVTLQILPNLRLFLIRLEQENDIQIGFVSENAGGSILNTCTFRIPIYGFDNLAQYNFAFTVWYAVQTNTSSFFGYIGEYKKRKNLDNPIFTKCSVITPNIQGDFTIDEYEFYFNQTLVEAFGKQNLDPAHFSIRRREGLMCFNKILERNLRSKL